MAFCVQIASKQLKQLKIFLTVMSAATVEQLTRFESGGDLGAADMSDLGEMGAVC